MGVHGEREKINNTKKSAVILPWGGKNLFCGCKISKISHGKVPKLFNVKALPDSIFTGQEVSIVMSDGTVSAGLGSVAASKQVVEGTGVRGPPTATRFISHFGPLAQVQVF